MSQIIVEQQFPYHVKMTSNRHFSNAIYPNRNAKLEKLFTCAGRAAKLASLAKFLWWQKFSLIWSLHIYIYIYDNEKGAYFGASDTIFKENYCNRSHDFNHEHYSKCTD